MKETLKFKQCEDLNTNIPSSLIFYFLQHRREMIGKSDRKPLRSLFNSVIIFFQPHYFRNPNDYSFNASWTSGMIEKPMKSLHIGKLLSRHFAIIPLKFDFYGKVTNIQ